MGGIDESTLYCILSWPISFCVKTVGECIFKAIMSLMLTVVRWSCET